MPNGHFGEPGPNEAKCLGCGRVESSLYPGCWGRTVSLQYLMLDPERRVGVCGSCVTPANQSRFWQATIPQRAVAK